MSKTHSWLLIAALALAITAAPARRAVADSPPPLDPQLQEEFNKLEPDFKDPKKPDLKGYAVRGNRSAPIMIVEYSDFQCPYCQRGFQTVEDLRQKYGKKIAFVFKNLPLSFHPLALPAAKRFLAVMLQSPKKAWEFHDAVFKNQQEFTAAGEPWLDTQCTKLKVNMKRLKKDMDGKKVADRLEAEQKEAASYGFNGTPGFSVNGVRVNGAYPTVFFEHIIERELKAKKPKVAKKTVKKEEKKEEAAAPAKDEKKEEVKEEKKEEKKPEVKEEKKEETKTEVKEEKKEEKTETKAEEKK